MSNFNPRYIIGKTVARVEMRPNLARDFGREKYHDPVITFTDGSAIMFYTEETDRGEYGTGITYHTAKRRKVANALG
jgi:hypothetical protein